MEWNAAAQILIAVLPTVAVITFGVLAFFYLMWDYRQNVKLIESGASPRRGHFAESLLLFGIVAVFIGTGLLVFFLVSSGVTSALLGGIIPLAAGLGIVLHWVIIHRPVQ
jgi:hypothetical protein